MERGIVKKVIGPVVDVHFPSGKLPDLYNAVEIKLPDRKVTLEVVQEIGNGTVRCIALAPRTVFPADSRLLTPARR